MTSQKAIRMMLIMPRGKHENSPMSYITLATALRIRNKYNPNYHANAKANKEGKITKMLDHAV